jgi:hypothetical protein
MSSGELDNLVRIGKLKVEPPSARELKGLLDSARVRLADAASTALAFVSRFDLAYNASHALALYALRRAGYRCDARYLVFQTLPHTLGLPAEVWRVLAKAHERRNQGAGAAGDLRRGLDLSTSCATGSSTGRTTSTCSMARRRRATPRPPSASRRTASASRGSCAITATRCNARWTLACSSTDCLSPPSS